MKKIKAINGYTIYQATTRDESKYNVTEGYFYLYFSSDIRDYGLSNSEYDYEAGSIEEATEFATGTNYAIAKEIVEETTTAASFEEILEVEQKLNDGMSREEIEEEIEEEPIECTALEAKIQNAIDYCEKNRSRYASYTDMENDAANLFADDFHEYSLIYEALVSNRNSHRLLNLYDFLLFFDESDNGQHRYVTAYTEEEATAKIEKHFRDLEKQGFQYPEFICNPVIEAQGVII